MAFTDLAEHLEETLGYGAGVFDMNWASGAARSVQDGYSYRDVPKFAKKTDSVPTAEIATWRKRMPPRGVSFAMPLETSRFDQTAERIFKFWISDGEFENVDPEVWRARLRAIRAARELRARRREAYIRFCAARATA